MLSQSVIAKRNKGFARRFLTTDFHGLPRMGLGVFNTEAQRNGGHRTVRPTSFYISTRLKLIMDDNGGLPPYLFSVPSCLCASVLKTDPSAPKGLSRTLSSKKSGRVVAEPLSVALAKHLLPLGVYKKVQRRFRCFKNCN